MKIVDIERIVVDVPFTKRQQKITAREVYNWAILELCRVETDTGHVGWGETVIHYTWARVSDESVARVIGQSPADLMHDDSLGAGLQMALVLVLAAGSGVNAAADSASRWEIRLISNGTTRGSSNVVKACFQRGLKTSSQRRQKLKRLQSTSSVKA